MQVQRVTAKDLSSPALATVRNRFRETVMTLRPKLETRLGELKAEYSTGQKQLQELEHQLVTLRETMLRISGAIMVLEELLSAPAISQEKNESISESQTSELALVR